jgi:hypothetical protein
LCGYLDQISARGMAGCGLGAMLADVKTYRCTGSYKHASSVSLLYMF